ncbi:MAG: hypothetical protein IPJ61_18325 [Tessaracoccus sp.]|uniref:hypothetical protein n=1 Tax=Tessaracoccus sp. TaxID=1971211 RepID=UPI001EB5911E|nr:hypothetical protein [Tessaracoccus sp.]MBK7822941.1 hypothetical protein [Tessaracoccus sp.]
MSNQILLDYAGVPRHRWEQVWRAPDVPRMIPMVSNVYDRFIEQNQFGRTIKGWVDLTELPTREEWLEVFPEPEAYTPPAEAPVYTPPVPQTMHVVGYPLERVRVTPIPPIELGAWPSVSVYEEWVEFQGVRRNAIVALSKPFDCKEGCEITVLQSLRNLEPVLDENHPGRIDTTDWWDRIERYAPGHPILAFRSFVDSLNDARPVGE